MNLHHITLQPGNAPLRPWNLRLSLVSETFKYVIFKTKSEIRVCRENYDVKLNYKYLNGCIKVDKCKVCFFEHGITYVRTRSLLIEVLVL